MAILDFWQAQDAARKRMVERAHAAAGKTGPLTVADVMDDSISFLESKGRPATTIADVRGRDKALIRRKLGEMEASALTADILRKWRNGLVKSPPRARTKPSEAPKYGEC